MNKSERPSGLSFFMTRTFFIFIACLLCLMALFSGGLVLSLEEQLSFSMILVILLGIPHGAIDNVIFLRQHKVSAKSFYIFYLIAIGLNALLWLYAPLLSIIAFLIISAYHFGQSQFSHYPMVKQTNPILSFSWGASILSAMLLFNFNELEELTQTVQGFQSFELTLNANFFITTLVLFTAIMLLVLLINIFKKAITAEQFVLELVVFALILFSFYVFPLIVGFTLYFAILHSLKVLQEEFRFVEKLYDSSLSLLAFGKLLFPYTTISVFGMALIYLLGELNILPELSFGYLLLILISSITLPHAFVMDRFYKKKQKPIK